MIRLLEKHK